MMTMRIPVAFGLFAVLLAAVAAAESKTATRPNIIFVLCDDLGPGDIGVLWQNGRKGKQKFTTPNMDQFAKEGMILNRHYCPAPSCMASRSSLMTGRHQGHCARRNTQFDAEIPDVHTLGTVMSKAGYATAAIGKWGMAGGPHQLSIKPVRGDRSPKTNPSHPTLRGFDYFYGYTAHRDAHYHYPKLGNRPLYDGFVDVTDRLTKCYSTDLLTARTKKWIIDHHKTHPKKPFFTYLCYTAPHAGLRIPTTSHLTAKGNYPPGGGLKGGVQWLDDAAHGQINTAKGKIDKGMHPKVAHAVGDDGQPWPDHARRHATMVRRIDDALADLIQLLKDLEIDDRTLVVLTSDNGTLREAGLDKVGSYLPDYLDTFGRYDGIKLDLWEGGVRMPTIVRWPSVIKAGSESDAASQFHDWMATFCDLSGVPVPAVSDGVSIVPTLTGKGEQAPGIVYTEFLVRGRTPNYVEFEAARRDRPHGQMQSVLIGDYKGIRVDVKGHQDAFEVYHTLKDFKETTDLAGKPGVPTQKQFQAAVLRSRRIDPLSKRPYDNALIPAVTGIATRPGLVRKEFPGQFDWVPQLGDGTPSGRKIVKGLTATSGAQQFVGYLRVQKSGVYHFALSTNGKAVARLHDTLLIDADSQYTAGSKALSGKIALRAGLHPLRINCLAPDNAPALSLEWQVPGGEMKPVPDAQYYVEAKKTARADIGIFNGVDLSGWKGRDALWSVRDGVIVGESKKRLGQTELLWSSVLVKDFHLAADVKLASTNQAGGIQFRSKPGTSPSQAIGYQADMGHTKSYGNLWGRLYHQNGRGILDWNTHGAKVVKPGDWNRYEILAVGHRIWTAVNGTLCSAVDDPQGELSGKIAFQLHDGAPQTIEIRIAAFSPKPKVALAGLTEPQLVARLTQLGTPKIAQVGKAATVRAPAGLTVSMFADHPQMTNPVAVDVDAHNRVYVAETFRFNRGTAENRTHSFMLEDDLQVQSLDDRMAMQRKWASRFNGGMDWFTSERDQINQLTDTDGDGRADTSSVLATFREPLDGLAAGVLPWGDDIWVACIPHLWRLRDADGDGKAEVKDKVLTGFGVRASFFGHDMHGLAVGPDNRLYFSVGDRGFNVTAKDGRVLKGPEQGAVFRCRRDGSGFEVLHRGMRNPQEIAFDEWGNLFAGDNNCDKGDKSRLVYVIDGGDSGWRMHYQSVAGTYRGGPWMAEDMWKRDDTDLAPAWLTPAAGYIGSGPSGLAYSAVGAWPEALRNQFYHCNFSRNRGIETFRTEPEGAGFRIVEYKSFLAPARTADCAFGYDGRLYAAEFIGSPWANTDTGHIFAVHPPKTSKAALALTALAKKDFSTFADPKLLELLSHDDQRLRLRAQDELAKRRKSAEFANLAADGEGALLQRVHAIWGLWQIGLDGHVTPDLTPLLTDKNAEIRAQAWRVLGDLRRDLDTTTLRRGLNDESARVQYFAARAVGRMKTSTLSGDLLSVGGTTSDPIVQRALVIALSRLGKAQMMIDLAEADNPKTRMIALLTLRRLRHREVTAFLGDADDHIVLEAARAAHDLGIPDTKRQLAQALERAAAIKGRKRLPMLRRVITANRIVGDVPAARRLCGLAVDDPDKTVRQLSLEALESWGSTVKRDPVTGEWRPIAPADNAAAASAMADVSKQLLAADRRDHWATAIRACQGLKVALPSDALQRIVTDPKAPIGAREAAFNQLGGQTPGWAAAGGAKLLTQPKQDGRLAKAIHTFLASSNPQGAIPVFGNLTVDDAVSIPVRQSAIAALTARKSPAAHDALRPLFKRWRTGKAPPGLLVELHKASAIYKEAAPAKDDAVLRLLHGGDAARGREFFVNHQTAQCLRCHRMGRIKGGGDAGPDLSAIAKRVSGPQLVEALVNPGARIAPGFGVVAVTRKDGTTVAGVLRAETADYLEIAAGDDPLIRVPVADIASRSTPVSAMPPMGAILTQHEIRDIVAFLATTAKRPPPKDPPPVNQK